MFRACKAILLKHVIHLPEIYTFLSWPALASNFPSEEKWQQTTLVLLLRIEPTSLKEKPEYKSKGSLLQSFRSINCLTLA